MSIFFLLDACHENFKENLRDEAHPNKYAQNHLNENRHTMDTGIWEKIEVDHVESYNSISLIAPLDFFNNTAISKNFSIFNKDDSMIRPVKVFDRVADHHTENDTN